MLQQRTAHNGIFSEPFADGIDRAIELLLFFGGRGLLHVKKGELYGLGGGTEFGSADTQQPDRFMIP